MPMHPLWRPFDLPTDQQIARARVGVHQRIPVEVVPYDAAWPAAYEAMRSLVAEALGSRVLSVAHVGSTSIPGMWAKPYIDVDLIVADSADESSYLPDLEGAGFRLRIREPEWEEHRCLRRDDPVTLLHVFSPGAIEPRRHLAFAEWLRSHPEDHAAYAAHKREVAARGFDDAMQYNNAKAGFIYDLYERIFAADPDHEHDPRPRPGG